MVDYKCLFDKRIALLVGLLIIVSLYDLLSPPVSVTIWRQTQTAMLTENFVREGFSLKGLYLGLKGHDKYMMTYEFPVYNFIVGVLFKFINFNPFWGKLVSLISSLIMLVIFHGLVKSITNKSIALYSSLLFILLPVNVLIFTSFQPDALGIMFLMLSILMLDRWRNNLKTNAIFFFSACLLLCGLCKFPLLVPYIPLFILMYLFPQGHFRFPKLQEVAVVSCIFIVPFISWYLYRSQLTDPILVGGESGTFLLGDLKRFLSPLFYIKPAIMLTMVVFCGTGVIYLFCGVRKISILEICILTGIPFYYIVVPTVADQYYYLYAVGPIAALFMGKGIYSSIECFKKHHVVYLNYALAVSFIMFSLFGIMYVLRMDKVILPASEAVRQVSMPNDLIFVVNMHDRGVGVGGDNPSVVYFAGRNGWNIQKFNPDSLESMMDQINSKRNEGVKWLLVSWYTPELEPWYSSFLPEQFIRSPKFNSRIIAGKLMQHFPVASISNNFAVLDLSKNIKGVL